MQSRQSFEEPRVVWYVWGRGVRGKARQNCGDLTWKVCVWGAFEISCHQSLVGKGEGEQSLVFSSYRLSLR